MRRSLLVFAPPVRYSRTSYHLSQTTVTVKRENLLGLRRLARQAGIRQINKRVKTKNFPDYVALDAAEYALLKFDGDISGDQISRLLPQIGYAAPTIREVLSFLRGLSTRSKERLLADCDLVALGSIYRCPEERTQRIPYINTRSLRLSNGTSFSKRDIFLIRKDVPVPAGITS